MCVAKYILDVIEWPQIVLKELKLLHSSKYIVQSPYKIWISTLVFKLSVMQPLTKFCPIVFNLANLDKKRTHCKLIKSLENLLRHHSCGIIFMQNFWTSECDETLKSHEQTQNRTIGRTDMMVEVVMYLSFWNKWINCCLELYQT